MEMVDLEAEVEALDESKAVVTDLSIMEKMLDFKYQPIVDQVYAGLTVENQLKLKEAYERIKQRNDELKNNVFYQVYYGNYVLRKVRYFVISVISFINVYFWGAFIKATIMWFIQGLVLRMWEPNFSLLKGMLSLAHSVVGNGFWGLFSHGYNFDPNLIKFGYIENAEEVINQGYEISVYLTFFTIIWFMINLLVFYLRNRKHWNDDVNHEFKYDLKTSLFMVQGDKDDDYRYIKRNFYQRYNRYVGSDFQKRKYLHAYINVIESDVFVSKKELSRAQKTKIIFKTNYAAFEAVIGLFTYIFFISAICLGVFSGYNFSSDASYSNALMVMMHEFSWWNSLVSFCGNLMNNLGLSGLYMSNNVWLNECFSIIGTIILIIVLCNLYKRCIRPTIRHYQRACNHYQKVNLGIYTEGEKFINISRYRPMAMMFYFIVLPAILFVLYNV